MKTLFTSQLLAALVGGMIAVGAASPALAQKGGQAPSGGGAATQPEKTEKTDKKAEKAEATAKVGEPAPSFELTDTDGKTVKLSDFKGKIVVLEWFNPECPFVLKHHAANKTMVETYSKFKDQNVVWMAINSGAQGKQGHGLELNKKMRAEWNLPYPILLDESGTVGRAYGAKRTPEMFIINKDGVLVYQGAIDDNASAKELGKTNYVAKALAQVTKGETVTEATTKAYGCSVKY